MSQPLSSVQFYDLQLIHIFLDIDTVLLLIASSIICMIFSINMRFSGFSFQYVHFRLILGMIFFLIRSSATPNTSHSATPNSHSATPNTSKISGTILVVHRFSQIFP